MNKTNWNTSIEKRFWSKVQLPHDLINQCWIWTGALNINGYGEFWFIKGKRSTHRLAYEYYNGLIQDNLQICHTCDNPSCVNPNHLWAGTQLQNHQDKKLKKRSACGSQMPTYKYEDEILIEILNKIENNEITCHADLLKEKCSPRNVMAVLRGEYRHNVGELFDLGSLKEKIRTQLTHDEVVQIKKRLKKGESAADISRSVERSYSCISQIKNNQTFAHIKI